jgi:dUTP pyrophosphatase
MSFRDDLIRQVHKFFNPKADSHRALTTAFNIIVDRIERTPAIRVIDNYGARKVRIHRLDKDLPLPFRANPTDAGYDVFAAEDAEFKPRETKLVSLGLIAEAPEGYHFKLYIRSSMALKRNFCLGNSVGIIDHSYAGKDDVCKAILKYDGPSRSKGVIKKGEKIGQLVLAKNIDIEWDEQEERDFRGTSRGGFGSSGR